MTFCAFQTAINKEDMTGCFPLLTHEVDFPRETTLETSGKAKVSQAAFQNWVLTLEVSLMKRTDKLDFSEI
jgi:hypothetical protein